MQITGGLPFVHGMAVTDETVEIGEGAEIWQFASVIRGAKLGSGCSVAANAIVDGAIIGSNTRIGHGASIHPGSTVGKECFIGPQAVLCNDAWPRAWKDGFDYEAIRSGPPSVVIGDGASVGARAIILPGVYVGAGAMVAAGSVVTKSVPIMHLWRRDGSIVRLDVRKVVRMKQAVAA